MQYASQEETKGETQTYRSLVELVEFDASTRAAYQRLVSKISYAKPDSNSFSTAFRLFKVPSNIELKFPTIQYLRNTFNRGIQALYIFKLHFPHKDGYTHGIHIRLHGFVPRRAFENLTEELVRTLTGQALELKAYVPVYNKSISLFDYLQSLYVSPANLLVNFSHHLDVLAELQKFQRPDTKEATLLRQKVQGMTTQIIENMVSMPSKFPTSYISTMLQMDAAEFKKHLRATSIQDMVQKVAQDAYSLCLQDKRLKQTEVQEFMQPMTRRSMLNRCITPKTTKQIQVLLQQQYNDYFVHPHPYNRLCKSDMAKLKPIDGLVFDPSFLFTMLMVSRWFARTCMVDENAISNNYAHLLLYGASGTGKSLLISAISTAIPTYKFLVDSHFQNPDLLQSSLLTMEEIDTSMLPSNKYKQLLDIKSHVKIDFKNLNPENCTEGMPCMMSTNDDIFTKLRGGKKFNKASVDAAIRRLYILPVKSGSYDKLHGRVPKESAFWTTLHEYDLKFEEEQDKLPRIFNLLMSFALFQQDIKGMYFEQKMHSYLSKIALDFSYTVFGTFYLANKQKVDDLLIEAEHAMQVPDQDDSTYLIKLCTCHGSFQQILIDFMVRVCSRTELADTPILRDKQVPWPAKAYYYMCNQRFTVGLMYESSNYLDHMNATAYRFITNKEMVQYKPDDSPNMAYADLQELNSYQDMRQIDISDPFDVDSVLGSKRSFCEMMGIKDIEDQQKESIKEEEYQ